jgi:Ca2+:H+ antiporter
MVPKMAMLEPQGLLSILGMVVLLVAAVLNAVHQAEVIAHKTGEPFGTLVLAVAVTIIEVALIVSIMLSAGKGSEVIARDSVYAAIMIVANGVIGAAIFAGGLRHKVLTFRVEGTNSGLAVLIALATLTLVLPVFTISSPGPTFSYSQLVFAGLCSLVLYLTYIFVQTVRHRDYFLPVAEHDKADPSVHAAPPSNTKTVLSVVLLLVSLVAVVLLAKALSPAIEATIVSVGAPRSVLGVVIAALVLLPEGVSAIRAALANRLQNSLNLALGSALASIGLTIPAVAFVSVFFDMPLSLGLDAVGMVFLLLTFLLSILTIAIGRATVLQGVVHLVIFIAYLFISLVP